MGDINDISVFSEIDPQNNSVNEPSFPEQMLPSLVNDNARALMGSLKRFRDWICAGHTVAGTANDVILTFAQSPYLLVKGDRYVFFPTAANTGATTLTIGNLPAKAVQRNGHALIGSEFQIGIPVELIYDGTAFQILVLSSLNYAEFKGLGQASASFDTNGALGGSIDLIDTGGSAGNGGAVIFSAAGGAWDFAAIKGFVTNGSGLSQGDIVFDTRTNAGDGVLSEKMRIAASGLVSVEGSLNVGGNVTGLNLVAVSNIFANGSINATNIGASNALTALNISATGSISVSGTGTFGAVNTSNLNVGDAINANTVNCNALYLSGQIAMARGGPYVVFNDGAGNQSLFLGSGADQTTYIRNTQHVMQSIAGGATYATFNSFGTTTPNLSVTGNAAVAGFFTGGSCTLGSLQVNGGGTAIYAPNGSIQAASNIVASNQLISGNGALINGSATITGDCAISGHLSASNGATISGQALIGEVFSVGAVRFSGDSDFYIQTQPGAKVINMAPLWYFRWDTITGDMNWIRGSAGDHTSFEANSGILNCRSGPVRGLGAYQDVSDQRLKKDIVTAEEGLDEILALRPVTFQRVPAKAYTPPATEVAPDPPCQFEDHVTEIGFIAQEVDLVLPLAVRETETMLANEGAEDSPLLALSYQAVIPVLVNAIKQLNSRICTLEGGTPPPDAEISPDGSVLYPSQGGSLVTTDGVWTFSSETQTGGNVILLDGAQAGDEHHTGTLLQVASGGLMFHSDSLGGWWEWFGDHWSNPV